MQCSGVLGNGKGLYVRTRADGRARDEDEGQAAGPARPVFREIDYTFGITSRLRPGDPNYKPKPKLSWCRTEDEAGKVVYAAHPPKHAFDSSAFDSNDNDKEEFDGRDSLIDRWSATRSEADALSPSHFRCASTEFPGGRPAPLLIGADVPPLAPQPGEHKRRPLARRSEGGNSSSGSNGRGSSERSSSERCSSESSERGSSSSLSKARAMGKENDAGHHNRKPSGGGAGLLFLGGLGVLSPPRRSSTGRSSVGRLQRSKNGGSGSGSGGGGYRRSSCGPGSPRLTGQDSGEESAYEEDDDSVIAMARRGDGLTGEVGDDEDLSSEEDELYIAEMPILEEEEEEEDEEPPLEGGSGKQWEEQDYTTTKRQNTLPEAVREEGGGSKNDDDDDGVDLMEEFQRLQLSTGGGSASRRSRSSGRRSSGRRSRSSSRRSNGRRSNGRRRRSSSWPHATEVGGGGLVAGEKKEEEEEEEDVEVVVMVEGEKVEVVVEEGEGEGEEAVGAPLGVIPRSEDCSSGEEEEEERGVSEVEEEEEAVAAEICEAEDVCRRDMSSMSSLEARPDSKAACSSGSDDLERSRSARALRMLESSGSSVRLQAFDTSPGVKEGQAPVLSSGKQQQLGCWGKFKSLLRCSSGGSKSPQALASPRLYSQRSVGNLTPPPPPPPPPVARKEQRPPKKKGGKAEPKQREQKQEVRVRAELKREGKDEGEQQQRRMEKKKKKRRRRKTARAEAPLQQEEQEHVPERKMKVPKQQQEEEEEQEEERQESGDDVPKRRGQSPPSTARAEAFAL